MNVYWKQAGGHVHMRFFVNGGKMGDLCCRLNEFAGVKEAIAANWVEELSDNSHKPTIAVTCIKYAANGDAFPIGTKMCFNKDYIPDGWELIE